MENILVLTVLHLLAHTETPKSTVMLSVHACVCMLMCTVSAQRSGEGEGVGDVVGGDLLLDQCHQGAVGDLAARRTHTHTQTRSHISGSAISWLINPSAGGGRRSS